jgi:putative oxidoreductase
MFVSILQRLSRILSFGQSPFLLLIRLYIGYQCVISGWAHLHHLDQTANFFASLHIPMPKFSVIMSAGTEIIFGALLGVGLLSRLSALALTGNFIVAMLSVQLSNYNFSYSDLGQAIWKDQSPILGDTAFPFLATALIVLFFGPGLFALDSIFFRKNTSKAPPAN